MPVSSAVESWREEQRAALLYRAMAAQEKNQAHAALFMALATEAEHQASIWVKAAARSGQAVPSSFEPDARTRIVAALVRWLGPKRVRGALTAMKVRGMSVYDGAMPGHPMPVSIDLKEKRHRGASTGGTLRATVFGVNDGLVSNCSLILGVVGAATAPRMVVLTGIAGMLAGAFSMAAGEYVSVRSQREMFEYQIALERSELDEYPEEEAKELALIYASRGLSPVEAKLLADRVMADPERALDTLAREELGLNPDELGSPWRAASSSFSSFAVGAFIPLAPFLLACGRHALFASIGLTAIALFAVGAAISLFTGRSALHDGTRMLLIGGTAGALTYAIGAALGVSL